LRLRRWNGRRNCIDARRDAGSTAVLVKAFKKIEANAPFGLNVPADLAELALYLAAPESDQLSGATLSVNGGISFPQY